MKAANEACELIKKYIDSYKESDPIQQLTVLSMMKILASFSIDMHNICSSNEDNAIHKSLVLDCMINAFDKVKSELIEARKAMDEV